MSICTLVAGSNLWYIWISFVFLDEEDDDDEGEGIHDSDDEDDDDGGGEVRCWASCLHPMDGS